MSDDDWGLICRRSTPREQLPEIAAKWADWVIRETQAKLDADASLTDADRRALMAVAWPKIHAGMLDAVQRGWEDLQRTPPADDDV